MPFFTHKPNRILLNKKAAFNYILEDSFESGLSLKGWEVKAMRNNKVTFTDGYVSIRNGVPEVSGIHLTPVQSTMNSDKEIGRKIPLLLKKSEIKKLTGATVEKGKTIVPVELYWKDGKVKLLIALARGKKLHDKKQDKKAKDLAREQSRDLKV